jgi:hypothetical protein
MLHMAIAKRQTTAIVRIAKSLHTARVSWRREIRMKKLNLSQFEAVFSRKIELVFFVPVIVYMSDSIGTETMALFMRELALRKVKWNAPSNAPLCYAEIEPHIASAAVPSAHRGDSPDGSLIVRCAVLVSASAARVPAPRASPSGI